ncbi:targeting protein for Xklp2-A-like [Hydractinia symbiolongicarpus]|uniref:targeting protein for Xklp2-A-like n=1 Tax=Hydractinia symbiolongicarpus TaxID=13093 RepID=UPI002551724F|nr:targeting protein for Xklp2-A-like [Hydractinia symbiolongicarpus]
MDEEIDSKYEFNAPKFIDFLQGDVDEDADKWFDEREGDEGGIDIDLVPYYEKALGDNGFKNATSAITAALNNDLDEPKPGSPEAASEHAQMEDKEEAMECDEPMEVQNHCNKEDNVKIEDTGVLLPPDKIKQERKSNMPNTQSVENVHVLNIKKERVSHMPEPAEDKQESEKMIPDSNKENNNKEGVEQTGSSDDVEKDTKPVKVPPRKSNIRRSWSSPSNPRKQSAPNIRRSQPPRQSAKKSINYSDTKKRKTTLSQESMLFPKKPKFDYGPTMPNTPSFVRKLRERGQKRGQSSEAIQLKKIRDLQNHTKEQLKRNHKNMKQAIKAGSYMPVRCMTNITKPKEFQFATDTRVKEHTMHTRRDSQKPFENQLRKHPPSPPAGKKESTKPKPFHFVLPDKGVAPKQKWESMAQFTMNFQTKTPERFRMKPRKDEDNCSVDGEKKKSHKVQVTVPKTPLLMTRTRSRPANVESAEEREIKEAESVKSYQFKATEFNPKIVEMQGMYGVKQVPEASTTQVKPFHFELDSRTDHRKQKEDVNKPAEKTATGKAKINTSLPSKMDKPKRTEVKPFSFESRDKERYQKKEEKIKEIMEGEKKLHEFHARPLPSFSPEVLPAPATKPITEPQPFHISVGSTAYQQKLKQKLEAEAEEERAKRQFKAQNADVVKNKPFKPLTGLIPPTSPNQVVMNSDIRAKERAKFEEWKSEQNRLMEMEKMRIQKEKELEEERQLKLMRKEAVPKSHPVRRYKHIELQKSDKPLTTPQTPNFECQKRALTRL